VSEHPRISLPIGIPIIGRCWEDQTVLKATATIEAGQHLVEIDEIDGMHSDGLRAFGQCKDREEALDYQS